MAPPDELNLVLDALRDLTKGNEMWRSNFNVFSRYTPEKRDRWWFFAQRQAEAGVPRMQELTLKVIQLRLTR